MGDRRRVSRAGAPTFGLVVMSSTLADAFASPGRGQERVPVGAVLVSGGRGSDRSEDQERTAVSVGPRSMRGIFFLGAS